jgi:Fe-S-cluster containining protein
MEHFSASDTDIARWTAEGREDILAKVGKPSGWIEPGPCPFAAPIAGNRYTCTIYATRPLVCRDYPSAVDHMKYVNCEMLEPGDTDETVARFMAQSGS